MERERGTGRGGQGRLSRPLAVGTPGDVYPFPSPPPAARASRGRPSRSGQRRCGRSPGAGRRPPGSLAPQQHAAAAQAQPQQPHVLAAALAPRDRRARPRVPKLRRARGRGGGGLALGPFPDRDRPPGRIDRPDPSASALYLEGSVAARVISGRGIWSSSSCEGDPRWLRAAGADGGGTCAVAAAPRPTADCALLELVLLLLLGGGLPLSRRRRRRRRRRR